MFNRAESGNTVSKLNPALLGHFQGHEYRGQTQPTSPSPKKNPSLQPLSTDLQEVPRSSFNRCSVVSLPSDSSDTTTKSHSLSHSISLPVIPKQHLKQKRRRPPPPPKNPGLKSKPALPPKPSMEQLPYHAVPVPAGNSRAPFRKSTSKPLLPPISEKRANSSLNAQGRVGEREREAEGERKSLGVPHKIWDEARVSCDTCLCFNDPCTHTHTQSVMA